MTSEETQRGGVVIPMWAWGIIAGALLMVGGWTATTLMGVRDQTAILGEKVRVLEQGDAGRSAIPSTLARLEEKITGLGKELEAMREDLRRERAAPVKPK